MKIIRSPICSVLGHVDHGKSSILDKIRGTAIVDKEAGKITQAIGASIIPLDIIKKVSGDLLKTLGMKFTIPGLLFIDTPGHAAFTNLRKRGGNLADIAILVIDINEGLKPQTIESIEILKQYKTPFVVAANKIDKINGFVKKPGSLLQQINAQSPQIVQEIEKRMYELVGKLAEYGFNSERFDRVSDYTNQIAIIPTSAMEGIGIPELLMVLSGLAQKFLENCLKCDVHGYAKGTVLEVKEEKGLGTTLDVIIYDGQLKVNDTIVIGGLTEPVVTKVKALLEPLPLAEMRDKKSKFKPVKEVIAATGVKISAKEIDAVISGMPIRSADEKNIEQVKEEIQNEVDEVIVRTDKDGIIIKADSLGGLEALQKLLEDKEITIRKASVGNISKKDIIDAESNYEQDPLKAAILGFNVVNEITDTGNVKVFTNDVIYKLIDDFEDWKKETLNALEAKELDNVTRPFKIEVLRGYVFRQSNPAVVGVEVLFGTMRLNTPVMNEEGKLISNVKSMQHEKESVREAEKGKQVATSFPNVTVGRQIKEGDVLYSAVSEEDFLKMKEMKQYLTGDEKTVLKQIADIMRRENPVWGI